MIRSTVNRPKQFFLATTLIAVGLIAGCGGGGSGNSGASSTSTTATSTAAEAISTSKSMPTTSTTALATASSSAATADSVEGAALSAGATADVTATNELLESTTTYLAATKAEGTRAAPATTFTKTIGGLTVSVVVTAQSLTTAGFVVTLNGSPSGNATAVSYSNFIFATGTITRSSNNGKAGTHFNVSYNEQATSGTTLFATSDSWVYDDGTGIGSMTFAATGTTTTWSYDSAGDWTWSVYQNGSATTGALRGAVVVNADGSGSAKLYCTTDTLLRSMESWTATGGGQFCTYVTACSPKGDRPCVTYP